MGAAGGSDRTKADRWAAGKREEFKDRLAEERSLR
jgi:hypothetical protein